MSSPTETPPVVWRFTDGKAGHEAQTRGLVQALAAQVPIEVHDRAAGPAVGALADLALARYPAGEGLPDPDLIVGAGRATHLPMLAARRARGGRIIVLMRPSLPSSWFDLVVAPAHDGREEGGNVLVTQGALTDVRPSAAHDPHRGLILVGGPSAHCQWSDAEVIAQVVSLVEGSPGVYWTLTTSRRTPAAFLRALALHTLHSLDVVPAECTDRPWLLDVLARAGIVWVSADSVSMVYEALTSGAAVGLLELPAKGDSRVARGMTALAAMGLVTTHAAWRRGARPAPPVVPFDEATRVAAEILKRWPTAA